MKTILLYLVLILGGTAAVVAGTVALGYDSLSALTGWDSRGTPEIVFVAICAVSSLACSVTIWKIHKRLGWY
ncbi:hypothetical protein B1F73_08545 [Pseudomonas syringae]|nr:hypothetical protein B1F73_08545 [Pseudomonas syringae]RXU22740.1 hypothetical protein B0A92_19340 [Pseudomonas syringae]